MSAIKFSVVIPTRERAGTLRHALRTCLDQNFENYEVIVSDNDSSPPTRAAVEEVGSPRISYLRTPELLPMASNWEFAVSQSRGEYIIVIGDDDALLPHALAELDTLTCDTCPKAVRWEPAYYTWPTFPAAGQGDYLRVPIGSVVREVDGLTTIGDVIGFREPPAVLPSIYHGAVRREVLDELRRKTGRVFPHRLPGIYSGFAVAAVTGRFLSVDVPMSVNGQSGASQSAVGLFRGSRAPADEFRTVNAQEGLLPDARVPELPVFPHAPVADAFFAAKPALFPDANMEVNRRQLAAGCVSNLRAETEADWREGLQLIRKSLVDDPATLASFESGPGKTPFRAAPIPRVRPARLGLVENFLHLDAAGFGVADVAAAAALCERILNYRRNGVRYGSRDAGQSAETAELKLICAERQHLIEELHQSGDELAARIHKLNRQRSLIYKFASWASKTFPRLFSTKATTPKN